MNPTMPAGEGPGLKKSWAYPLAGAFIALAPLTTFLANAGYSFIAAESLLCLLAAVIGGLACGALMAVSPGWLRIAVAAVLLTLLVDVQSPWFKLYGVKHALIALVGIAACCWFIRRRLGQVLALVGGAAWLASFTVSATPMWKVEGEAGQPREDKPVFVQIILDEHIGLEGIPEEFDPDGAVAAALDTRFRDRGFTVFSRAYSRYFASEHSISTALNFEASRNSPPLFLQNSGSAPYRMTRNATTALLRERGYRVYVIQTPFIDLCRVAGAPAADVCATYVLESVRSLQDVPLSSWMKARSILSKFRRLSAISRFVAERQGWSEGQRTSALAAKSVVDRVASMLARARPGDAYLIHLMLPHFPYMYDASCNLRVDSAMWLNAADPAARPLRNSPESRRVRYPLYLEQLACTQTLLDRMLNALKAAGVYEQATILVHGDHGSRIFLSQPRGPFLNSLTPQDYVDAYSTLFAVKLAGRSATTDRRVLPLELLLGAVVRDGALPGKDVTVSPSVVVDVGAGRIEERPLPDFANGRIGVADANP